MAINNHHTVEEINGVRCSVVEKGISTERAAFINNILNQSGFKTEQATSDNGLVTVGVADVTFNIQHALYGRMLKTNSKQVVSPAVWLQKGVETGFYWEY
jgi:hypothetical protein